MEEKLPTSEDIKSIDSIDIDELMIKGSRQKRACFMCEYWSPIIEKEGQQPLIGYCRINPPTIIDIKWPMTDLFDWCGKFERKV